MSAGRDMTPAVGEGASPAWARDGGGDRVALHVGEWRDGRWSYLYPPDSGYADAEPAPGQVAAAARGARGGEDVPEVVLGPVVKPPVWTWEVPLYFWFGGIAAGSSFVALACDLAGDARSAAVARKVAVAAVAPCPPLLIADLGRPARFLNMLRIFKPRSPMSMGAWCLVAFSNAGAAAVASDLAGRPRAARALGALNAVLGGYLGSYTGVLLASTAVPVWSRSRLLLGPIFVSTATATGAAACRLTLAATGLPAGHPTSAALSRVEAGAIAGELALSIVNERAREREGLAAPLHSRGFRAAKASVLAGLALRLGSRRRPSAAAHASSALFLLGGALFRYAWVAAGRESPGVSDVSFKG